MRQQSTGTALGKRGGSRIAKGKRSQQCVCVDVVHLVEEREMVASEMRCRGSICMSSEQRRCTILIKLAAW
jgi:hypothetical protein